MTINLTDLKAKAEAATPGEWTCEGHRLFIADENGTHIWVDTPGNAAYIAAANPATILSLLDRVKAAEDATEQTRAKYENLETEEVANGWRTRIAALEAENKRLRDALAAERERCADTASDVESFSIPAGQDYASGYLAGRFAAADAIRALTDKEQPHE